MQIRIPGTSYTRPLKLRTDKFGIYLFGYDEYGCVVSGVYFRWVPFWRPHYDNTLLEFRIWNYDRDIIEWWEV